jgi:hypothetical protein
MVAVLALIHKPGGRCSLLMASPRSSVLRIRDSRISRRFRALYRQLTLRPARLITTSASSSSLVQSSSSPFHETTRQGATAPVRDRTVTASPLACERAAMIRPRCPAPPGITMRRERREKDSRPGPVSNVYAVMSVISVYTEHTATGGDCQELSGMLRKSGRIMSAKVE